MRQFTFHSSALTTRRLDLFPSDIEVKSEPMLFNCSHEAALDLGGPLTRAWLNALAWAPDIVDMPGWYPCVPGWHHDDVTRTRPDGQPNYDVPQAAEHAMTILGSADCATEFAFGRADFPEVRPGRVVYGDWHPLVEQHIQAGRLRREPVDVGTIVYFDAYTWHRGVPCVRGGWRWFARASRRTMRTPTNEVRAQVQVYLPAVDAGW